MRKIFAEQVPRHNDDECSIIHKLRVNDRKLFSTTSDIDARSKITWRIENFFPLGYTNQHDDESAKNRFNVEQDKFDWLRKMFVKC